MIDSRCSDGRYWAGAHFWEGGDDMHFRYTMVDECSGPENVLYEPGTYRTHFVKHRGDHIRTPRNWFTV